MIAFRCVCKTTGDPSLKERFWKQVVYDCCPSTSTTPFESPCAFYQQRVMVHTLRAHDFSDTGMRLSVPRAYDLATQAAYMSAYLQGNALFNGSMTRIDFEALGSHVFSDLVEDIVLRRRYQIPSAYNDPDDRLNSMTAWLDVYHHDEYVFGGTIGTRVEWCKMEFRKVYSSPLLENLFDVKAFRFELCLYRTDLIPLSRCLLHHTDAEEEHDYRCWTDQEWWQNHFRGKHLNMIVLNQSRYAAAVSSANGEHRYVISGLFGLHMDGSVMNTTLLMGAREFHFMLAIDYPGAIVRYVTRLFAWWTKVRIQPSLFSCLQHTRRKYLNVLMLIFVGYKK